MTTHPSAAAPSTCKGHYDNIRRLLNPQPYANFILLLIIINSIMMGIATFPLVKNNNELSHKFDLTDQIFLIIFTIESAMQLIYFGLRDFFKDGFRVFDFIIVILSWAMEGTQVIRAFRIFRVSRLISRVETLRTLVLAIFMVIPKMNAIFMLLGLIFFIFGVMFTTLFKGMYLEGMLTWPYFETLYGSFFTLFQMMTLDSWTSIARQVEEEYTWAWVPFVIFVILTGFIVVNLLIAVICDAVSTSDKNDRPKEIGIGQVNHTTIKAQSLGVGYIPTLQQITTAQRLEELQQQLDDLVVAQEQMGRIIEILSSKAMRAKIKRNQQFKK